MSRPRGSVALGTGGSREVVSEHGGAVEPAIDRDRFAQMRKAGPGVTGGDLGRAEVAERERRVAITLERARDAKCLALQAQRVVDLTIGKQRAAEVTRGEVK